MADNTNSYTYKRYLRNKNLITLLRKFILVLSIIFSMYILFVLWLHPLNIIWVLSVAGLTIIFVKWVNFELKLNSEDKSWNYHTWGKGAGAELLVSNQLESLPSSYKVISDFYIGKGNIDNIIVCPKGIFVIEIKATKGSVEAKDSNIYINNKMPHKNYLGQTIAECMTLKNLLNEKFNYNFFITGILEFPNATNGSSSAKETSNGMWIGGYKCHEVVLNQTNSYLDEQQINDIYQYLLGIKEK